ncbi:MEKHLA domain-containing protein [Methylomonas paludis]|uniref:MEKHLA domain-containing protein n=1 Tax=Methylomonas paludis TaxID=1173101 RepID=A0A975MP21_9GAMM|nr:MEKHLA domain-containing protein [Methylomonas paludis]QWF70869.1 MEKHLA domain-containing protein [Methylomonas paludis]
MSTLPAQFSAIPCPANHYYSAHIDLLLDSYQRSLNASLLSAVGCDALAQQVFAADFVLVSHNSDADPLFNYANLTALSLFEFSWNEFIGMPSRCSAEPVLQAERERLLAEVTAKGFIDNYSGVRISKSGRRFKIQQAVVWNVFDAQQNYYGQAACFKDWFFLS